MLRYGDVSFAAFGSVFFVADLGVVPLGGVSFADLGGVPLGGVSFAAFYGVYFTAFGDAFL